MATLSSVKMREKALLLGTLRMSDHTYLAQYVNCFTCSNQSRTRLRVTLHLASVGNPVSFPPTWPTTSSPTPGLVGRRGSVPDGIIAGFPHRTRPGRPPTKATSRTVSTHAIIRPLRVPVYLPLSAQKFFLFFWVVRVCSSRFTVRLLKELVFRDFGFSRKRLPRPAPCLSYQRII